MRSMYEDALTFGDTFFYTATKVKVLNESHQKSDENRFLVQKLVERPPKYK